MTRNQRKKPESAGQSARPGAPSLFGGRRPKPEAGFGQRLTVSLRRRILTGTLIVIPLIISMIPVWILGPKLTAFGRMHLRIDSPVLGFAAALLFVLAVLYIIGLLSATFVVRWIVRIGEGIATNIPVVNFLYRSTKQVVDLVQTSADKPFNKVVLVEYPKSGVNVIGFVTGEDLYPGGVGHMVHVFVPTTPNPTSGFLLLYSAKDVLETNLIVEQAVRFIMSGGILDLGEMEVRPYQSDLTLNMAPAGSPVAPGVKEKENGGRIAPPA